MTVVHPVIQYQKTVTNYHPHLQCFTVRFTCYRNLTLRLRCLTDLSTVTASGLLLNIIHVIVSNITAIFLSLCSRLQVPRYLSLLAGLLAGYHCQSHLQVVAHLNYCLLFVLSAGRMNVYDPPHRHI